MNMKNESLRGYISTSVSRYISIIIVILILFGLIYIPPLQRKIKLQVQREKWASRRISHYRFDLTVGCPDLCLHLMYHMPVTIEVKDGKIISMIDANVVVGDAWLKENLQDIGTVERLFDRIQKDTVDAEQVYSSYDEEYGFPSSIHICPRRGLCDYEMTSYKITNFEVLP
jgi:hypothetical protein